METKIEKDHSERLLVLEPDTKFLVKYVKALDDSHIGVLAATNVREALAICSAGLPKAAILHVPSRNEFMIVRKFLKKRIPYVRLGSPSPDDTGAADAHAADGEHILSHPAEVSQLVLVAKMLCEVSELRKRSSSPGESEEINLRDPVTRFYPFKTFKPLLAQEIKRAQRYRYPLSLLLLCIDDYDNAVSRVPAHEIRVFNGGLALAVSQTIRDVDWPVEYGNGKILLLFPHTPKHGLMTVASRIHKAVGEAIYENGDIHLTVTASFGGTSYEGSGDIDFTAMLKSSTDNLTAAQKAGGNHIVIT